LGFDATRRSIVDGSLAHNRVIHFATHGIVDSRHPEMSGIILSLVNARGEHEDGYLRLSDIYNLKLTADLVVLSSCESALGKDLESEGTIGLPRGFLYAGARSVIASLWKIDDDATAILMKALYLRMQQGESPSGALHDAELELSKDERFADPYYWAAFVVEGDYK
jgi:CHAT domain-containing protein